MRNLMMGMAAIAALVLAVGPVWATEPGPPPGELTIQGKKPARFSHEKHLGQGMECGQCHHDADHAPLTAEAIGKLSDSGTLQCATCHKEGFANAKLQRRKDVFHARCRTCHKEGYNGKKGPTRCNACHLKKKRKKLEGC